MKKKRILAVIMLLTLTVSMIGCGKSDSVGTSSKETTTKEESSEKKNNETKSNDTKKTSSSFEEKKAMTLALGDKQSKAIKEVVEKYGVHTSYDVDNEDYPVLVFTKDKDNIGITDTVGYNVKTKAKIMPNDGGNNKYYIEYMAEVDKNHTIFYLFHVIFTYPNDQEFKLDNFKMFRDLVKASYGDSYDLNSLESFIQKQIETANKKTKKTDIISSERDIDIYHESLMNGEKREDGTTVLNFRIELKGNQ